MRRKLFKMKTPTYSSLKKALDQGFFMAKITLSSMFFITQTLGALIVDTSKKSRVLICIYLLLLTQALLVLFSTESRVTELAQASDEHMDLIEQHISPNFLNEKPMSEFSASKEFYAEDGEQVVPETRDGLINAAIMSLNSENGDEFVKYIEKAKELDPNWRGWLKEPTQ